MPQHRHRGSAVIDKVAARELDLYIENTGELYNQFKSIIKNIKTKIRRGTYDPAKAPALWAYWYEAGAKRYVKEFGGDVRMMFPKALRDYLARERAVDEYKRILAGEYDWL